MPGSSKENWWSKFVAKIGLDRIDTKTAAKHSNNAPAIGQEVQQTGDVRELAFFPYQGLKINQQDRVFNYQALYQWTSLPPVIREAVSSEIFKANLPLQSFVWHLVVPTQLLLQLRNVWMSEPPT